MSILNKTHLECCDSSSLVRLLHVALQHLQLRAVQAQVGVDQLEVDPELGEHNGLGQWLDVPNILHVTIKACRNTFATSVGGMNMVTLPGSWYFL